jgi:hypothetical protein
VLTAVIAALEGFDRVLLLRATLLQRPEVQAASILRYAEGQAELHLVLERPETPQALCGMLADALGRAVELRAVDPAAGTLSVVLAGPPGGGSG